MNLKFLDLLVGRAHAASLSDYLTLGDGRSVANVYDTPAKLVNLIVSNLFVVAGIVIFFLIIGAGYSFLQNSSGSKEEAKKLATGAVIGFIIMFSAYWIVQIIAALTGVNIPI